MSQTSPAQRPLSPHLQIYRWPITMATSILHRVTGMALALGTALMAIWLIALASGPESFAGVQALFGSPLGQLVLFGYTWAIFYHLMNGVRHLVWDLGAGFTPSVANAASIFIFVGSAAFTLAVWAFGVWL